jgi:hypothetical protein
MDFHLVCYYIGIIIVFGSHIYTLSKYDGIDTSMYHHSLVNIFAAMLIAYYFMNKEEFIDF